MAPASNWICGCCWLHVHFSCALQAVLSCAASCPCTAVLVVGFGWWDIVLVTQLCALHTHAPKRIHPCTCAQAHPPLRPLAEITCFTRTPERGGGWGGGREERHVTSCDISISVIKDTTALKVPRWAVCTSEIKSPNFTSNIPKLRHVVHLFVLRNTFFLLCTRLIINNRLNSAQTLSSALFFWSFKTQVW